MKKIISFLFFPSLLLIGNIVLSQTSIKGKPILVSSPSSKITTSKLKKGAIPANTIKVNTSSELTRKATNNQKIK